MTVPERILDRTMTLSHDYLTLASGKSRSEAATSEVQTTSEEPDEDGGRYFKALSLKPVNEVCPRSWNRMMNV